MTSPTSEALPAAEEEAKPSAESPSTVGLGGCLGGFVVGGLTLWGGDALLDLMGLQGGLRTGLELGVMGLGLGACLFFWKVAATADRMAREREAELEEPEP